MNTQTTHYCYVLKDLPVPFLSVIIIIQRYLSSFNYEESVIQTQLTDLSIINSKELPIPVEIYGDCCSYSEVSMAYLKSNGNNIRV